MTYNSVAPEVYWFPHRESCDDVMLEILAFCFL